MVWLHVYATWNCNPLAKRRFTCVCNPWYVDEPHGMNARAIQVMAEAGVDISGHHSKHLDELKDVSFDYVVAVCDHAHESCPIFPGRTKVVHVGFDDPPADRRT